MLSVHYQRVAEFLWLNEYQVPLNCCRPHSVNFQRR